jgi:hypothetical protein
MVLERDPAATAEQKAEAYKEVLQPDGPFKQRLALLDKWLVGGHVGVQLQECSKVLHCARH